MPNAKDLKRNEGHREIFCMTGPIGSGKTAQFLTLPGKKFLYIFDPSAVNTIRGLDIDYASYYPDSLDLSAKTLAKMDKTSRHDHAKHPIEPTTYVKWEQDFERKLREGFFDQYQSIGFDSFTTFSDLVMDRILWLNGRPGKFPERDDWGAQMNTIKNVTRTLTGMDKTIFFTAHVQVMQDELTSRIQNQLVLTGQLKTRLPLLFSEIYYLECRSTEEREYYVAQTRPDRMNPTVRCTLRRKSNNERLAKFEDVTIEDWAKPEEYGLGKLIKECV